MRVELAMAAILAQPPTGAAGFSPTRLVLLCQIASAAPPGHECPGYASTEKPGEPGSWRSGSDFGAGFSRLFVFHVARAFMPGRGGGSTTTTPARRSSA